MLRSYSSCGPRSLSIVVLMCASAPCAHTQQPAPAAAPGREIAAKRCIPQPVPGDTTVDTVFAVVSFVRPQVLPDTYRNLLALGVRQYFGAPSLSGLEILTADREPSIDFGRLDSLIAPGSGHVGTVDTTRVAVHEIHPAPPERAKVWIEGSAELTVRRSGALAGVHIVESTASAALDSQLVHAVVALDSAHVMPSLPDGQLADSVRVDLRIQAYRGLAAQAVPLFVAKLPRYAFRMAAPRADNPRPAYPKRLESHLVPGQALASFIVRTDGTVDMSTVRFDRKSYREFAEAVMRVLPRWHFQPAMAGECPVAQHVEQPFNFRIPR